MPRPCLALRLAVLLAGSTAAVPPPAPGADLPDYLALALPMTGIEVDGDLSDWPREMPSLPVRNEFGAYGPTDTEGTDLATSRDLSPSFRVGWDPEEQLLYVAVEVRDDVLHPVGMVPETDACEVYVSGLHPEAGHPLQFALVPGWRTYPTFDRRGVHRNLAGDRRSRGAWRRQGDLTTYEWRLEVRSRDAWERRGVFDPVPDQLRPFRLEGGGIIGFDVVVVDGDGSGPGLRDPAAGRDFPHDDHRPWRDNASWVPWGPPVPVKMMGDGLVGRLVLAPEDWSAGFDAGAMDAYLEEWVRDHPHDWNLGHRRWVERPHSHGPPGTLDPAPYRVAPADASQGSPAGAAAHGPEPWEAHGPAPWDGRLLLLGGGLLGLALGLAVFFVARRRPGDDSADLGERLTALESRMTDTQDVMIALSEKLDRMDARDRKADEPAPPA